MNLTDAARLARKLMYEHNLADWKFQFDRSKRRFGCCHQTKKMITLSETLVRLNEQSQVEDCVLHEIAHALVGPRKGHGDEWKAMARAVGADPTRCYDSAEVETPVTKWIGTCPVCGVEAHRHNRPASRPLACSECYRANGKQGFQRFVIVWRINPNYRLTTLR